MLLAIGVFCVGLLAGAVWHWAWVFPFPQISALKVRLSEDPAGTPNQRPGCWRKVRARDVDKAALSSTDDEARRLLAIGYLAGTEKAPEEQGVTVFDKNKCAPGLNLVVSGHAPEAALIDMEGRALHIWSIEMKDVWPDQPADRHNTHTHWVYARLMPDGELLAIFSGIGIVKLDKDSRLVWDNQNRAHHHVDIARDGTLYVLTREARVNRQYNFRKPILEDYISILDSEGHELRRISILEAIQRSKYKQLLRRAKRHGDILHANYVDFLEDAPVSSDSPFKPGRILVSLRELDLVCVIDPEHSSVTWGESDLWSKQHCPALLPNGSILVFDNRGGGDRSRVIEYAPEGGVTTWMYEDSGKVPFYSPFAGRCQRLTNGNTLITESDSGRAFEVTRKGTIVWEYLNPHRAGEDGELIACLFHLYRIEDGFPLDWLNVK